MSISVERLELQLIRIKRAKIFLWIFIVALVGCWISLIVITIISFLEGIATNTNIIILVVLSLLIFCALGMFLYVRKQLVNRITTIQKRLGQ